MAKMGQGKMSAERKAGDKLVATTPGLSVVIPTIQMATTAVIIRSTLGVPIMREGFITETGFLPSSMVTSTAILSAGFVARN